MRIVPAGAPVVDAATMRAAEVASLAMGVSQDMLMERAGIGVAREVARLAFGRPILVVAGPGNNGGDAYVAAFRLRQWGHDVSVAALCGSSDGAAARMRARWDGPVEPLERASPRPVLVDGLFGTGLARPLADDVAAAMARLVGAAATSIAIDLPSGLGTDDAKAMGAAPVDVTIALGALKPAHVLEPGIDMCGHVLLVDIGVETPRAVRTLTHPRITAPPTGAHKYRRGLVVVLGGEMPGAARLAARAALHGGAGYVILAGPERVAGLPDAIVQRPVSTAGEVAALLDDERIGAVVIGPGLGRGDDALAVLDAALRSTCDLVIDGDALTLLGREAAARVRGRSATTILTPHGGEFAAMFGAGAVDKITATRAAAQAAHAVVVHKGACTVIATPGGRTTVAADLPSWLSTAGTGDVLAGLLAARHAACRSDAAADEAVWLHGRAAAQLDAAFAADDLISAIAPAIGECR